MDEAHGGTLEDDLIVVLGGTKLTNSIKALRDELGVTLSDELSVTTSGPSPRRPQSDGDRRERASTRGTSSG